MPHDANAPTRPATKRMRQTPNMNSNAVPTGRGPIVVGLNVACPQVRLNTWLDPRVGKAYPKYFVELRNARAGFALWDRQVINSLQLCLDVSVY